MCILSSINPRGHTGYLVVHEWEGTTLPPKLAKDAILNLPSQEWAELYVTPRMVARSMRWLDNVALHCLDCAQPLVNNEGPVEELEPGIEQYCLSCWKLRKGGVHEV